jgi:hypothetical protein
MSTILIAANAAAETDHALLGGAVLLLRYADPAGATRARSIARPRLSRQERSVVIVLILLLPVLAIGTVGNQQIFNA